MRLIGGFFKKYWYIAILGATFMMGEVFMDLFQPRLMAKIVDRGILGLGNNGVSDPGYVLKTGIVMILTVLLGGCCGMSSGVCANISGQRYGNGIRKKCYENIMHFSFQQTDAFSTGSLITRITNDVNQLQQMCMQLIRGAVRCTMLFLGGSVALLTLDLSFGVIAAIAMPFILIDIVFVLMRSNPLFILLQNKLDRLNGIMQEDVGGIRVVKAFVQEKAEEERFGEANKDLVSTQYRVELLLSFMRPVMNIILNAAVVGIIYVGGIKVADNTVAPGVVMAAITYISQILNGMMMMAMTFQTLSRGLVSAKRLEEVLQTRPAIVSGEKTGEDTETKGLVEFRHVDFAYPDTGAKILHDLNFEIRPGETFAIIGATGSGKTTLASLIPRFYEVTGGQVLVDGIDVKEYDLSALREKVTTCLQKSELFSATIRENIDVQAERHSLNPEENKEPDPKREAEIKKAAADAQAESFILNQPDGYDTKVAERGMSLSGGQRQRISIARALLRHSEIMIFDDSTSALDLSTEAKLYEALKSGYGDVTKIIIAQRIASVKDADRILVLERGRVAGLGSHEELLASSEIYRAICDSQLKNDKNENRKGA